MKRFWLAGSFAIILLLPVVGTLVAYVGYHAWKYPPRTNLILPPTLAADEKRGYAHRANLDVAYQFGANQQYRFVTNEQGARRDKPGGRVDLPYVLAVGDSQTFGSGISYTETYSARLEALLRRPVLNLGVSGYGTVSAIRMAEEFLTLKPKVVILGYYYDHAVRSVSPCYPGFMLRCLSVPYVVLDDSSGPRIMEPCDNRVVLETQRTYNAYISGQGGDYSFWDDFYWTGRRIWADALQSSEFFFGRRHPTIAQQAAVDEFLLQAFNERVTAAGARAMILYIPDYFGLRVVPAPDHLTRLVKRLGIDFIDLTSDLQSALDADPNSIKVPNDGHLNERGHELMARRLYERIENMSR